MDWQRSWRRPTDRGASSVIVALMMVPLLAFAALAVDIGAVYADRQQLQTGADAGALAIAQDCAREACGDPGATAQDMAGMNLNADGAVGAISSLDEASGEVRVQTSTVREHWFAPLIGIDQTEVQARAGARWGYPTGGTAVMPLTFSACELDAQEGITVVRDGETNEVVRLDIPEATPDITVEFTKTSENGCTGRSGNEIPGGFGWLSPRPDNCWETESIIGGQVDSDPGASAPAPCTEEDFREWIGKTVLLPIFDDSTGSGSGGEYTVIGYAGFTLSGFSFPGAKYPSPAPCNGDTRCVRGSFDRFVDLTDNFDYSPSGPRLGAAVVALTE